MADEDKNKDEEQDDFFGEDDDFGLPDLDYEALGDEEESTDETSVSDESEKDGIYTEESFDDFDPGGLDGEVSNSVFDSDDTLEDEFKEFESEESEEAFQTPPSSSISKDDASASKGKFVRTVIFGTILFVGLGFGSWYAYTTFFSEEAKEIAQKKTPKKAQKKKPKPTKPVSDSTSVAEQQTNQPDKTNTSTKVESKPETSSVAKTSGGASESTPVATNPGTINNLSARTGNTFVIIGSFVDGDIARDFAGKLASEGKSPSIIPPFGKGLFYRVAIAGFPTIASAQQNLDGFKNDYGQDVWILRY